MALLQAFLDLFSFLKLRILCDLICGWSAPSLSAYFLPAPAPDLDLLPTGPLFEFGCPLDEYSLLLYLFS